MVVLVLLPLADVLAGESAGSSGTPDVSINAFAADFDPIARIADAGGPTNRPPIPNWMQPAEPSSPEAAR